VVRPLIPEPLFPGAPVLGFHSGCPSASSRKSCHVKLNLLCVSKGRGTSQIAVFSPSKLGFAKILIGSAKRPKSLVNMKRLFGRGTSSSQATFEAVVRIWTERGAVSDGCV
jgi:hypothetical protein